MYNPFFSKILSLLISVSGNALLMWFFLQALFSPIEHAEFIFNTGVLLFLVEFLSIHSGFMVFNITKGGEKIGIKEFLSNVGWSDPFNGKVGEWLGIRGVKFFILQ